MRRLVAALALTVFGAGCGPFSDDVDGSSGDIAAAVRDAHWKFRLADATDFEWDRFYVFDPYFTQDTVDKQLGFHWGGAEDSAFTANEGGAMLVFVRDGKVVKAFDQAGDKGDFSCLATPHGMTPEQAVLRTQAYTDGQRTWKVVRGPGRLAPGCPF